MFHMVRTLPAGGRSAPILIDGDTQLFESTDIVRYADRFVAGEHLLMPPDAPEIAEFVEEIDRIGPQTRRVVYFNVLDDPATAKHLMCMGVGRLEASLTRAAYVPLRELMRKGMRIHSEPTERALKRVEAAFDRVAEMLGDRRYLFLDRFTAADLTFASLVAPVLSPAQYAFGPPDLHTAPASMQELVARFRAHPAGVYAFRVYQRGADASRHMRSILTRRFYARPALHVAREPLGSNVGPADRRGACRGKDCGSRGLLRSGRYGVPRTQRTHEAD